MALKASILNSLVFARLRRRVLALVAHVSEPVCFLTRKPIARPGKAACVPGMFGKSSRYNDQHYSWIVRAEKARM